MIHAIYLRQDYGMNLPTLVIDGKTPPRAYSMEALKNDLVKLWKSRFVSSKKVLKELHLCFFSRGEKISVEAILKKIPKDLLPEKALI